MGKVAKREGGGLVRRQGGSILEDWLSTKSDLTQKAYRLALEDFAKHHGLPLQDALDTLLASDVQEAYGAVADYRLALQKKVSPSTLNGRLAALRSFCTLARRLGKISWALEIPNEPTAKYRDLAVVAWEDLEELLSFMEMELARNEHRSEKWHTRLKRDITILVILMDHALRRAEVSSLVWPDDVDLRDQKFMILSKGRRRSRHQREPFPMSGRARAAISRWLDARGRQQGPLIGLKPWSIAHRIKVWADASGVGAFRCHATRHAAITRALDQTGGDVRRVQQFSRHKDAETVLIYDSRRKDLSRSVVDLVSGQKSGDDSP